MIIDKVMVLVIVTVIVMITVVVMVIVTVIFMEIVNRQSYSLTFVTILCLIIDKVMCLGRLSSTQCTAGKLVYNIGWSSELDF